MIAEEYQAKQKSSKPGTGVSENKFEKYGLCEKITPPKSSITWLLDKAASGVTGYPSPVQPSESGQKMSSVFINSESLVLLATG